MNIPIVIPLVNGKSYEFADVSLNVLGADLVGCQAINYGETADIKNVYTTGRFATSRTYGQVTPTASITFLMEDVQSIMAVAPFGRIYEIPEFDIVVCYTDASLIPVKHVLKNVKFAKQEVDTKSGGGEIPMKLDLVISHIDWGTGV